MSKTKRQAIRKAMINWHFIKSANPYEDMEEEMERMVEEAVRDMSDESITDRSQLTDHEENVLTDNTINPDNHYKKDIDIEPHGTFTVNFYQNDDSEGTLTGWFEKYKGMIVQESSEKEVIDRLHIIYLEELVHKLKGESSMLNDEPEHLKNLKVFGLGLDGDKIMNGKGKEPENLEHVASVRGYGILVRPDFEAVLNSDPTGKQYITFKPSERFNFNH